MENIVGYIEKATDMEAYGWIKGHGLNKLQDTERTITIIS